jgi:hypothetical protein
MNAHQGQTAKAATTTDFLSDLSLLQQAEDELLRSEAELGIGVPQPAVTATIAGTNNLGPSGPLAAAAPAYRPIVTPVAAPAATTVTPAPAEQKPSGPVDELARLKAELEKQRRQLLELQQKTNSSGKRSVSPPPSTVSTSAIGGLDLNAASDIAPVAPVAPSPFGSFSFAAPAAAASPITSFSFAAPVAAASPITSFSTTPTVSATAASSRYVARSSLAGGVKK